MDLITTLLLLSIVWIGFSYNMLWLGIIGGVLFVVYVMGFRQEKRPVASGGPKIRPIIVKRRYTGPASIYPSKMKIKVRPDWDTRKWWERAFGAGGSLMGLISQGFRPKGPGEKRMSF